MKVPWEAIGTRLFGYEEERSLETHGFREYENIHFNWEWEGPDFGRAAEMFTLICASALDRIVQRYGR